jgi:hypothetical protein
MGKPSVKIVRLDSLVPDPENLRVRNEGAKGALETSVRALGAARSIVVDSNGVVRAGNGTLEAAVAAGLTEALIVETDGKQLVVVKRPDWTAEQALAYAIADNRTGELSWFDIEKLSAAITSLAQHALETSSSDLVDSIGFSAKELEALIERNRVAFSGPGTVAGDVDAHAEWEGMPGYEHTTDEEPYRSVVVHFKNEGMLQQFCATLGIKLGEKIRYMWYPEIEIRHASDKRYAVSESSST